MGRVTGGRALPPSKPKPRPKGRAGSPGYDIRAALACGAELARTQIEGAD